MNTPLQGGDSAVPMTPDILAAYADIQGRLLRATSPHLIERYERSLNELLMHPYRVGDPRKLVNAAYGNAGKVVRNRNKRVIPLDAERHDIQDVDAEAGYFQAQIRMSIDRCFQTERARQIAYLLLSGHEAEEIACILGLTKGNTHVLISRVRKQARIAWE